MGEAFGMWPEDVMEKPGSLMWAARWAMYRNELARVKRMKD